MDQTTKDKKPDHRLYCVIRIEGYTVQALANIECPEFEPIGEHTIISNEREEMYQLGRSHGGLLCNADGVPTVRGIQAFALKRASLAVALRAQLAATAPAEQTNATTEPPKRVRKLRDDDETLP